MSEDGLKRMLANSLCYGMYDTASPEKRMPSVSVQSFSH